MDTVKVFCIIVTKNGEKTDYPYFVKISDLDGITEGKTLTDAVKMAMDYVGTYSLANQLPASNTQVPTTNGNSIALLIAANISEHQRKHDHHVVKKAITIPKYLNELGKEQGINFSEVMTVALKKRLGVQ